MAENQNENNNNINSNDDDPYKFFKFEGPDNSNKDKNNKNKKNKKIPFWPIALLVFFVVILMDLFVFQRGETNSVEFSEFKQMILNGQIVKVELGENYCIGYGPEVRLPADNSRLTRMQTFANPSKSQPQFRTTYVMYSDFIKFLDENHVEFGFVRKQSNYLVSLLLSWIIPFAIIYFIWFLIMRKMGGGAGGGMGSIFNVGQSKAKVVEEGKIKTRFTDVAGVDEAKEELVEVVDFLKSPKKYTDIGGKIPKGVLLVGEPGTGKTLLARAVAGEAGVPFFSISGSDFVEMFVGVGASRVRDLFKQAREKAPCIVFIDEIDALGKSRANSYSSNDEREQTLNQLLVEMDGFDNEKGLIILAATNRADVLDPALLRPGRFDRHVPVELPDVKGREDILKIHAKNVKLEGDVDFQSLAHATTGLGLAGADLANVVNEAALLAVRNNRKKVSMTDFYEAIDKVSIGLKKKSRKDNTQQMRLASVHETGHALVGAFTPDYPPVSKITVVPRSHGIGGFTQYQEEDEKFCKTFKDMMNEVDTLLGGRAAEEIILKDISTGASNDIARATAIIKSMIVDFGMSDKFKNMTLGRGVLGNRGGEPNLVREFSEETQKYIDEEIARIMDERYAHVLKILKTHKSLLEYVAERLQQIETMDGKEFYEIVKGEQHCKELEDKSGKAAASEKAEAEEVKAEGSDASEEKPKKTTRKRTKKTEENNQE